MSIVNDALKKAEKEFEFKAPDKLLNETSTVYEKVSKSDKKYPAIIPVVFIAVGLLSAWTFMSHKNSPVSGSAGNNSAKAGSEVQSVLNNVEQKIPAKAMKPKDAGMLNGIVCGDEGKWAIVDDKIVKEGDNLLDGEIVSITNDSVKIKKENGSELILSLK
jgi:hypothetical protein